MNYNNAQFITSYGTISQLPPCTKPEIVFAGKSNVGKSTCINKIFNRKNLARTSSQPGKTITINLFDCDGLSFIDLPGYGFAKVPKQEKMRWAQLMEGYFKQKRDIRLIFFLLDSRHNPTDDDLDMLEFLQNSNYNYCLIFTKFDKLTQTEKKEFDNRIRSYFDMSSLPDYIAYSSVTNDGVKQIKELIDKSL